MAIARSAKGAAAAVAVCVLVASLFGLVATPARAAAKPTGLKVVSTAARGFAVSWKAVPGAVGYRVRISKSKNMANPVTANVDTNYAEWTRMSGNPSNLTASRLKPGTRYYVQVKVLDAHRRSLSSYSAKLQVKTKSKTALPELAPAALSGTAASGTSLYLSWRSNGPGVLYRVRYGTNPKLPESSSKTKVFTSAGGILTGLKPSTKYYFKVRVLDANRAKLSAYSKAVSAKTSSSSAVPGLVVASYNVLKPGKSPSAANSWENRRGIVVANLKAQKPDILGLQEATGSAVTATNGISVKQYADLDSLLGSTYRYVSTNGTAGTRLAYNTKRLTLVNSGTAKLTTAGAAQRYAVWAVLHDELAKRQVFVVNTHLEPPPPSGASADVARRTWETRSLQANEVMDLVTAKNTGKLPVVVTADLNSSRATKPSNGAYREFIKRGYVDPLGNSDDTWFRITPGTAEHEIGVEYNSFNNLERKARRTAYPVGTHVDYILVSKGLRVAQMQTVLALGRDGRFAGPIPSDHNLVTATIHLK